jgi:hypothetical protein
MAAPASTEPLGTGPSAIALPWRSAAGMRTTHRLGATRTGTSVAGRELLPDALGEAGTPETATLETHDDHVSTKGRRRLGDAAHQLLVALPAGGSARREVVGPPPATPADVSHDVASSPVRLLGQLNEPQFRVEMPGPVAGEHEGGTCGVRAIERHENLSVHLGLPPGFGRFRLVRDASALHPPPFTFDRSILTEATVR